MTIITYGKENTQTLRYELLAKVISYFKILLNFLRSKALPIPKVLFSMYSMRNTEMIITQFIPYRAYILLEEVG